VREKPTSKKVGSLETSFRGEGDHREGGREAAVIGEKGKGERSTLWNAQGEHFPKAIGWENERS